MGLDITVTHRKRLVCPKCGEVVGGYDIDSVDGGGRAWYDILEAIGYYVPYDKRTEENDWYGKDMILTDEQAKQFHDFANHDDLYGGLAIARLIAAAKYAGDDVVINADW